MPTYEYQCKKCGHTFEELQTMAADPLVICPNCGKPSLKRLLTGGAGMIFKGSGFYLTDYKKSGTDRKTTSKPSKAETKPESKPAEDSKPPKSKKGDEPT
jgi:putative FmdB family regulatory protein